jgi:hypothetical protein
MAKAIPTPHYAKVFCARKMLAHFPYRAQKTFVYSRNVRRKFAGNKNILTFMGIYDFIE